MTTLKSLFIVVAVLGIALTPVSFAQQANDTDPNLQGFIPPSTYNGQFGLGDVVAGPFDVEFGPFDNRCLGVEEAAGWFYVTGRGHTTIGDDYKIHRYDLNGTYLDSFPQVTNSVGWAGRDMEALDNGNGTHTLWVGSDAGEVSEYTITDATGAIAHVTLYNGVIPDTTRALCRNPGNGHFFSKSFSADVYEFDLAFNIYNQFADPTTSTYGFGWDATTSEILAVSGAATEVVWIDPTTGQPTGREFPTALGGAPGGGDVYTDTRNANGPSIVALHQTAPDSIVVYDTTGAPPPPPPPPGDFCTLFDGGNSFAGNMWDVKVKASAVTIEEIIVHLGGLVGESCDLDFYHTISGVTSYSGVETDPTQWMQVGGTVTVNSNGFGVPTEADVADFQMTQGDYGFYFDQATYSVNSHTVAYTNGNGANQFYTNADFDFNLGIGRGNPAFSGSIFNPRVWNGCFNYSTGGFSVTIAAGTCPGAMTFQIDGATPNAPLAVVRANGLGTTTVGAPCGTVTLGLSSAGLTLQTIITADGTGSATLNAGVPAIACGNIHAQIVDLSNCATSNTLSL